MNHFLLFFLGMITGAIFLVALVMILILLTKREFDMNEHEVNKTDIEV